MNEYSYEAQRKELSDTLNKARNIDIAARLSTPSISAENEPLRPAALRTIERTEKEIADLDTRYYTKKDKGEREKYESLLPDTTKTKSNTGKDIADILTKATNPVPRYVF